MTEYILEQPNPMRDYKPESQELVEVTPEGFLATIGQWGWDENSAGFDRGSYEKVVEGLKAGAVFEHPLFIDVDEPTGRVTGHEGRHRALAAQRLGVEWMPLIIFHQQNHRMEPVERSLADQVIEGKRKEGWPDFGGG